MKRRKRPYKISQYIVDWWSPWETLSWALFAPELAAPTAPLPKIAVPDSKLGLERPLIFFHFNHETLGLCRRALCSVQGRERVSSPEWLQGTECRCDLQQQVSSPERKALHVRLWRCPSLSLNGNNEKSSFLVWALSLVILRSLRLLSHPALCFLLSLLCGLLFWKLLRRTTSTSFKVCVLCNNCSSSKK